MTIRRLTSLVAGAVAISLLGAVAPVKADTVKASCSVYPKGSDSATSSGPCTFSQRQGFIGITLENGKRYDLSPVGDGPDKYKDQNGHKAHREDGGLGDTGQIYRLHRESIFVYWDPNLFRQGKGRHSGGRATAAGPAPQVGTTVASLRDLIGAKAGQAENMIIQRGYTFVKSAPSGDAVYSTWREPKTKYCVTIRTANGRYESIVYTGTAGNCAN